MWNEGGIGVVTPRFQVEPLIIAKTDKLSGFRYISGQSQLAVIANICHGLSKNLSEDEK